MGIKDGKLREKKERPRQILTAAKAIFQSQGYEDSAIGDIAAEEVEPCAAFDYGGKIEKIKINIPEFNPGDVLVQVAGCGVCRTDLGYYYDGVPRVKKPLLTLAMKFQEPLSCLPRKCRGTVWGSKVGFPATSRSLPLICAKSKTGEASP